MPNPNYNPSAQAGTPQSAQFTLQTNSSWAQVGVPVFAAGVPSSGLRTTGTGSQKQSKTCSAVPFTVTGIGPHQAPNTTAISQTPRADIPNGGVAIKPRNFGVQGINSKNRSVFLAIRLYVNWGGTTVPVGIPTQGPYTPVDVIGPSSVRNSPGNMLDVYNYTSTSQAEASTRTPMVTAVIPINKAGVKCPK